MKKFFPTIFLFLLPACVISSNLNPTGRYARTVISPQYQHNTLKRKRIAVMPFLTSSGNLDFNSADMVAWELMQMGFIVVDRSQLEAIFKELRLNMTGALSPKDMKEVGKLLTVDMIVTGTKQFETVLDGYINRDALSVRMIDVETGEILIASYCCDDDIIQFSEIPQEIALSIGSAILKRSKEIRESAAIER